MSTPVGAIERRWRRCRGPEARWPPQFCPGPPQRRRHRRRIRRLSCIAPPRTHVTEAEASIPAARPSPSAAAFRPEPLHESPLDPEPSESTDCRRCTNSGPASSSLLSTGAAHGWSQEGGGLPSPTDAATQIHGAMTPWIRNPWGIHRPCGRLQSSSPPGFQMTDVRPFADPVVRAVFQAHPSPIRRRLLVSRDSIFATAAELEDVGPIEETLRWNQPSYLTTTSGSARCCVWAAKTRHPAIASRPHQPLCRPLSFRARKAANTSACVMNSMSWDPERTRGSPGCPSAGTDWSRARSRWCWGRCSRHAHGSRPPLRNDRRATGWRARRSARTADCPRCTRARNRPVCRPVAKPADQRTMHLQRGSVEQEATTAREQRVPAEHHLGEHEADVSIEMSLGQPHVRDELADADLVALVHRMGQPRDVGRLGRGTVHRHRPRAVPVCPGPG